MTTHSFASWFMLVMLCLYLLVLSAGVLVVGARQLFPKHHHTWTKWEHGNINIVDRDYEVTGQRRYCSECNFKELRRIDR